MDAQKKLITGLSVVCGVAWVLAAIKPVDRTAWVLENLLLVIFVIVLSFTWRRLKFSNVSWIFIALFVLLHIIGAHYTYARMPLGLWAKDFFGLARNDYDRVAHFAFGLLLSFPVRELLLRFSALRGVWSFWMPPAIILASSGFFEILESIVAEIMAPRQGVAWLGGQGDEWDAQNDMASALIGGLFMMAAVALVNWKKGAAVTTAPRTRFAENCFLQIVLGCYVVIWAFLAIGPIDRGDWFLENLLVFAAATVLVSTYGKFQFSNFSYALIAIFLVLHAIGAHYTYSKVPAGFWLADLLHLKRNHFDRLIHFAFGVLLLYPMRELLIRSAGARQAWASWLAAAGIVALSSLFEILEAIVAQIVSPELGTAYLGTQGDIWDAQKDMIAALAGAALSTVILMAVPALRRRAAQP